MLCCSIFSCSLVIVISKVSLYFLSLFARFYINFNRNYIGETSCYCLGSKHAYGLDSILKSCSNALIVKYPNMIS